LNSAGRLFLFSASPRETGDDEMPAHDDDHRPPRRETRRLVMPSPDDPDDALVSRAVARIMLGRIGKEKHRELEETGQLRKYRLSASPKGHVLNRLGDVRALMVPEVEPPGRAVPLKRAIKREARR
jgi:hypothetical protein